jgi:hypothetical protein
MGCTLPMPALAGPDKSGISSEKKGGKLKEEKLSGAATSLSSFPRWVTHQPTKKARSLLTGLSCCLQKQSELCSCKKICL